MELLSQLAVSLWGPLAIIGLVALSGVLVAGRTRRKEWARHAMDIDSASDHELEKLIRRAELSQRAADYLHIRIRHLSYIIILASALSLTGLPYLRLPPTVELPAWIGLNVIMLLGGFLLLLYWHGWDDDREVVLRRQIRLARERLMEARGLTVRDHQTGVYSVDFWLHSIELEARRGRRAGLPITCLVIQITGLNHLREHGAATLAAEVLRRFAQELQNNVRAKDVVCRSGDDRFAIGLFHCQPSMAERIAERVTRNVRRMVLDPQSFHGWRNLHLVWSSTSLPKDGSTSVEVLRRAERALDDRLAEPPIEAFGTVNDKVA
jgi:diguanylate cyclase (GGDEF)-like protein